MTHIKNVEALDKVLNFCMGYGGRYNPIKGKLQLSTMNALLTQANEALRGEKLARNTYNNTTNTREVAFKEIPKLASSMVFTLAASGASAQTMNDARLYFRQVTGKGKDREPIPSSEAGITATPKRKRSGKLSYTSVADNFERLVAVVSSDPNYQPNEESLKAGMLEQKVMQLKNLNGEVIDAKVAWSNGLITRNHLLYINDAAIGSTITAVKKYVRAVFGLNSQEYSQIKNIVFTKPKM